MFSRLLSRVATFLHLTHPPVFRGWKLYLFVSLILISETAALSSLNEYSTSGNMLFLVGGLFGYLMVSTFLIHSYDYEGMGIVNVLWSAFSVLFVVLAGMFFFGEHVTTVQWCGTAMVIAGVVILRLPVKKKQKSHGGRCLHLSSDDVPALS